LGGTVHVILTQPHFVGSPARITSQTTLDGNTWPIIKQSEELAAPYTTFLAIDKLLGATLHGREALQVNFVIDGGQLPITCSKAGHANTNGIGGVCPTQIVNPAYWLQNEGRLGTKGAKTIKEIHSGVRMLESLATLGSVFMFLFGLVSVVACFKASKQVSQDS
jgi:hypothetical protein